MRPPYRLARTTERPLLYLKCFFQGVGTSYLLRDGDRVEVWVDQRMIGDCPADLVLDIIGHHFRGLQLIQEIALAAVPPRPPLAPAVQAKQLARAAQRRTRT